eukprot:NODE_15444_length_219_cov_23.988235_g14531_i0.p3 GENE.NODE_15444_length_219_cov_23.988235_g14531_i0~~NODE_15444_length_219_cov_23.988235_g14531_i0.p3  ORF type:complete len:55 (-),score=17.99 NODE_15444_length_219_cov_23.988235_g14531_i0:55-189(-)
MGVTQSTVELPAEPEEEEQPSMQEAEEAEADPVEGVVEEAPEAE